MQRKNLLLATTALALLGAVQQAQADGMYVSVFGGANFAQDASSFGTAPTFNVSETIRLDSDTGFVIGGAIGAGLDNWVRGLRVELEASYRRNDVGGSWSNFDSFFGSSSGLVDANQSTFALMANVAYDVNVSWKVKPYVMAGAGWARSSLDGALSFTGGGAYDTFVVENSGFAWQVGAGFNYEVAPGVDVGLGYRYFDGPNTSFFAGKNLAQVDRDGGDHAVTVNLTIDTN